MIIFFLDVLNAPQAYGIDKYTQVPYTSVIRFDLFYNTTLILEKISEI